MQATAWWYGRPAALILINKELSVSMAPRSQENQMPKKNYVHR